MAKITKALKDLGVAYTYSEDVNENVEIKFSDDSGKEHNIKSRYDDWSGKIVVILDEREMDNQNHVCRWIESNKNLLTDYETYQKEQEEIRLEEEEWKKKIQIKVVHSEIVDGYTLTIKRNLIGNQLVSLENKNIEHNEPYLYTKDTSPSFTGKYEVGINKGSLGFMNPDDCEKYVEKLSKLLVVARKIELIIAEFTVK